MDLQLRGRSALVTAASYGLGYHCARALALEGAEVAICSRDRERIERAASEIGRESGSRVTGFSSDLTDKNAIGKLAAQANEALGKIDILVLSTGHPPTFPFSRAADSDWARGIELILNPAIEVARAVLPGMQKRKYGRLIFIGSIFGLEPEASSIIQSTLRTGLNAFAKCIATEYAADNITANVICPGYFETPLVNELASKYAAEAGVTTEAILNDWRNFAPARKFGKPEDLGALAAFLASPRAEFVNGTTIVADGGALKGV